MPLVKIRAALETALEGIVGIIPSVVITASVSGTVASFTTETPHKLVTGLSVTLSEHADSVPDLNGDYLVTVTGASSFTLLHKVTRAPIASTANGVGGVIKANLTAREGVTFAPVAGVPFQKVHLLPATPENPTYGDAHSREIGYLQVTLYYPKGLGTFGIMTRAGLIKSTFPRGSSFTHDSLVVHVLKTPVVLPSVPQDENIVVIVKIPYYADVFS